MVNKCGRVVLLGVKVKRLTRGESYKPQPVSHEHGQGESCDKSRGHELARVEETVAHEAS